MADMFDWKVPLREIGAQGYRGEHRASASELSELTRVLDIVSCDELVVSYEIHALSGGMYRLNGHIRGKVVQSCVVTLEPIAAKLDEPINVELRPAHLMPEAPEGEQEVLETADIEPIEGDSIDLGLIVLEFISTGLDPYPRKEGATLEFSDPAAGTAGKPFSALAKLKDPS